MLNPGKYKSRTLEPCAAQENPTQDSIRMREAQRQAMGTLKGQQMMAIRQKLPAWKQREDLLNIIARNQACHSVVGMEDTSHTQGFLV